MVCSREILPELSNTQHVGHAFRARRTGMIDRSFHLTCTGQLVPRPPPSSPRTHAMLCYIHILTDPARAGLPHPFFAAGVCPSEQTRLAAA